MGRNNKNDRLSKKKKVPRILVPTLVRVQMALQPVQDILDELKETGQMTVIDDVAALQLADKSMGWLDAALFIETVCTGMRKGLMDVNYNISINRLMGLAQCLRLGEMDESTLDGAISEMNTMRRVLMRLSSAQLNRVSKASLE